MVTLKISNRKGNIYTITGLGSKYHDPICNCAGFKFKGTCKHINEIKEKVNESKRTI